MAAVEKTLLLMNKVGLHARPASMFVQTAMRFRSTIDLTCNGRQVDAKRILQVLQLGAGHGAELQVRATGEDANEALAALDELVRTRFGEEA